MLNFLSERLKFENFDTTAAEDISSATKMCNQNHYDAAIVDGDMEHKNIDIPTIVVVRKAEVESAVEALRSGAVDYLSTPVDMNRLLSTLRNISGESQTDEQQHHREQEGSHPRGIYGLSLSQGVVQCFQYLLLEHRQIDNTECREKKTARNGYDAGGSSTVYVFFFVTHARLCFNLLQYYSRASRDVELQPFLLVLLVQWVEVSEVTDAVV